MIIFTIRGLMISMSAKVFSVIFRLYAFAKKSGVKCLDQKIC